MTGRLSFWPLTPELVRDLPPLSAEGVALGVSIADVAARFCVPDFAWAAFLSGRLVGAAGLIECREGTLAAWAYLAADFPEGRLLQVVRFARAIMALAHARGFRRIECTVRADFGRGIRFAQVVGFLPEGIAKAWASLEVDGITFGRVKTGAG